MDPGGQCRHQHLPAPGGPAENPGGHPRVPGDLLLRRPRGARHARPCPRGMEAGHRAPGAWADRRRTAAAAGDRGPAAYRLPHHPDLRPHGSLRPGGGMRRAARMAVPGHGGTGRAQGAPGGAVHGPGGNGGAGPGDPAAGAPRRAHRGRDHVPRQHDHEGLSEEPPGHGQKHSRADGSTRAIWRWCSPTAMCRSATAPRT